VGWFVPAFGKNEWKVPEYREEKLVTL
jgi:hypothetical protein